jgi:alpha-galactosidase
MISLEFVGTRIGPKRLTLKENSIMPNRWTIFSWQCVLLALFLFTFPSIAPGQAQVAPVPPMGWNSYDGFGATVDEAQFRANAQWFAAHLKPFGWLYVVIDFEWYVSDPLPEGNSKTSHYRMDQFGRFLPAVNRFPSATGDAGFRPIADFVHGLGLKFGIHILRGIPKQAVERNLPIAGSQYRAADAADTSDTCPWNYDNYGVAPNKPASQAYYDSLIQLYAGWGVDLIKTDCIASHPYKADEIRMLSAAIRKSGRPIVFSVSPGPAAIEKANEIGQYAQMWRISDDIWDMWHNTKPYPQGLGDQFANAAKWAGFSGPDHWPDADMLPIGHLGPAPGWGKSRDTQFTHDEQRTLLTLWAIFRSPLMVGGDLTAADDWTIGLLTNAEVIAVDQHSKDSQQIIATDKTVVWLSRAESGNDYYLAVFNVSSEPEKIHYDWRNLGLPSAEYRARDLWDHKDISGKSVETSLPSHGCLLYRVSRVR